MKSMRRNERSQFLISPDYAFGEMGCPPRIPPDAASEFSFNISWCSVIDLRVKLSVIRINSVH